MKKLIAVLLLLSSSSFLFAQCPFKYGANEDDSLACLGEITNFDMHYKNKNYNDAYEAWRNIVSSCPCSWDALYTRSQILFESLIKNEKDSTKKEHLIDTLLFAYDQANISFPDKFSKGYCMSYKAYNKLKFRSKQYANLEDAQSLLNEFSTSIELEQEKTSAAIWNAYYTWAKKLTDITKDTSYVIEAYGRATDYIDVSINNAQVQYEKQVSVIDSLFELYTSGKIDTNYLVNLCKKPAADTTKQMKIVAQYKKALKNIETSVAPYASCEVLEELYSKKLESIKDDISAVNKVVVTMAKSGCLTSPTFKEALEIQHKAKPSRTSAYWMGMLSLRSYGSTSDKSELEASIAYLKEAVDLSETNEQKTDANYLLATAYMTKGDFSESRTAAYAALKANPNFGKAYILIGDLYARSGGRCSSDLAYDYAWAAADKYAKAVAVDPSCAEQANKQRAGLRFPSSEDLFKRGINKGSSYHVGCWIQENTTVR